MRHGSSTGSPSSPRSRPNSRSFPPPLAGEGQGGGSSVAQNAPASTTAASPTCGAAADGGGGPLPMNEIEPTFRQVDTCAAEFEAVTPYYYATYEDEDEIIASTNQAVAVIGSAASPR